MKNCTPPSKRIRFKVLLGLFHRFRAGLYIVDVGKLIQVKDFFNLWKRESKFSFAVDYCYAGDSEVHNGIAICPGYS